MLDTACQPDQRRYPRVETRRAARLAVGELWLNCTILDMSGGGARLRIDQPPVEGSTVVLTSEDYGILAATVTRCTSDGVSLAFGIAEATKHALIDKLTRDLNANLIG